MLFIDNAPTTSPRQGNLVSHVSFLERRAWRAKIAADARRLVDEPIDLQVHLVSDVSQTDCSPKNVLPVNSSGRETR